MIYYNVYYLLNNFCLPLHFDLILQFYLLQTYIEFDNM